MGLQTLEQRVRRAIFASTLGGSLLFSGCVGMERGGWITSGPPEATSIYSSPSYSSSGTSTDQPIAVDYVYYEPSSSSSDLNLLSFILSMTSFGAAQQGFIPQSMIMDAGSAAVGRQAIIAGQKESMQQGRSLYWPGSKLGFLITQSRQFGITWTVTCTGIAEDGDGKPQIEEFLGTGNSFKSTREFEVGCLVENQITGAYYKIFNEKNEVVLMSGGNSPHVIGTRVDSGTLKPGVYLATFYGQVPYVKPTWHSGPPRGIVRRDYILGNIQFEVTP